MCCFDNWLRLATRERDISEYETKPFTEMIICLLTNPVPVTETQSVRTKTEGLLLIKDWSTVATVGVDQSHYIPPIKSLE